MPDKEDPSAELTKLRLARGRYKGQITKIESWLNTPGSHDEFDVDAKLEMMESYYKMFLTTQDEVEVLNENEVKERETVDLKVSELRARLKRMRFKRSQKTSSATLANQSEHDSSNPSNLRVEVQAPVEVPLPKLATFDGEDYLSYPNFIASFGALVDQSNTAGFTKLKKFGVLRGALRGRALQAIEHLIMSEDNYQVALDILKERFLKPRLIFQSLLKKLMDLPKQSESCTLRQMLDKLDATLKALERIPATMEEIGTGILMNHVMCRVDDQTLNKWEDEVAGNSGELPNWNEFQSFLSKRADKLESRRFLERNQGTEKQKHQQKDAKKQNHKQQGTQDKATYLTQQSKCTSCEGSCKSVKECKAFKDKTPRDRYSWIRSYQYCIRCLQRLPHKDDNCEGEGCSICKRPHHTMLHFPDYQPGELRGRDKSQQSKSSYNVISKQRKDLIQVLGTAIVKVRGVNGVVAPARALIDSGSMTHYITKRLARKLRIKLCKATAPVVGLFGETEIRESAQVTFQSCTSDYERVIDALVLPEFEHLHPTIRLDLKQLNIPSNVPLADPTFNEPQKVDMLLGVGLAFKMLMVGQIDIKEDLLLQKTQLGWIVAGELTSNPHPSHKFSFTGCTQDDDRLQESLERFWELERVPVPLDNWSAQERFCEDHFQQHTTRNDDGRFTVRLPLLRNPDAELGDSYQTALARLKGVERRMEQDDDYRKLYQDFLTEYEELGHMHEVQRTREEKLTYLIYNDTKCFIRPRTIVICQDQC